MGLRCKSKRRRIDSSEDGGQKVRQKRRWKKKSFRVAARLELTKKMKGEDDNMGSKFVRWKET